jgi:hypothetical protein
VRTTLTLDPDVAAKLRALAKQTGLPFKQIVNERLRLGLQAPASANVRPRFVLRARPMGLRPGINLDSYSELLDSLDGPGS